MPHDEPAGPAADTPAAGAPATPAGPASSTGEAAAARGAGSSDAGTAADVSSAEAAAARGAGSSDAGTAGDVSSGEAATAQGAGSSDAGTADDVSSAEAATAEAGAAGTAGDVSAGASNGAPGLAEDYDERQIVRVSASSAVVGVAVVVLALLAQRVFVAAHRPLSWAVASIVVAILIDPLVSLVGRHFPKVPRVVAVLGALLIVAVAAFGMVYRAFDDLSQGLDRLGEAAKDAAEQVEERDDGVGQLAQDVDATRRVDDFVDAVEDRVTGGEDVLASTAGTAPTYFIGAIFTVFLMSYGPRLARSALLQIPDAGRRERVAGVVERALVRGRRAVLFTLGEGLLAGLGVGLTAWALHLPAPSALGLAAGLVSLLPHVGLVLGGLPFLLLMLGLRSDVATIVAAVVMIAVQLFDSLVIRPWIADRSVHIGLLVPWLVTLIGYRVYGVGGAAYSLAFAAFGLAAIDEIEWRGRAASGSGAGSGASSSSSSGSGEAADGGGGGAAGPSDGGGRPTELPPAGQPVSG